MVSCVFVKLFVFLLILCLWPISRVVVVVGDFVFVVFIDDVVAKLVVICCCCVVVVHGEICEILDGVAGCKVVAESLMVVVLLFRLPCISCGCCV